MKKANLKKREADNSTKWVEIEPKEVAKPDMLESLEVRLGSYVVYVPPRFDKNSLIEVCKVLLSL